MLEAFYKLGALRALADWRVVKTAAVGELVQQATSAVPAVVQALAKREAKDVLRNETRNALGLETPQWREHSVTGIPALAAQRLEAAAQGSVPAMIPDTIENAISEKSPEPEPPETPAKYEKPTQPEETTPDEG